MSSDVHHEGPSAYEVERQVAGILDIPRSDPNYDPDTRLAQLQNVLGASANDLQRRYAWLSISRFHAQHGHDQETLAALDAALYFSALPGGKAEILLERANTHTLFAQRNPRISFEHWHLAREDFAKIIALDREVNATLASVLTGDFEHPTTPTSDEFDTTVKPESYFVPPHIVRAAEHQLADIDPVLQRGNGKRVRAGRFVVHAGRQIKKSLT